MEVKINKDYREYTESIFFGLNLRQFIFSALAVVTAVAVYFIFKSRLGLEIVSWLCVLCAVPFAALGFVKFNGMPAETLFLQWFKCTFLIPNNLVFRAENNNFEAQNAKKSQNERGNHK